MPPMMDQNLLEMLRAKVGGDYILATLFQKRMRDLSRGLPPLVKTSASDPWQIIAQEILQDKLSLAMGEEAARLRAEAPLDKKEEISAKATATRSRKRSARPAGGRPDEVPETA
jgi:hypothetical protein